MRAQGLLDGIETSYLGETKVTETSFGRRRTGRTGTLLAVLGGYATLAALKLLIPSALSRYYQRDERPTVAIRLA